MKHARALRHGLAATALVVAICAVVSALAWISALSAQTSQAPAETDRVLSGLIYPTLVALAVLGIGGYLWLSRARLFRKPARECRVRLVRFQRGLFVRFWLETEEAQPRWIPVFFEPGLLTLPSPVTARLHGKRLIAAEIDGLRLYPSGRVRTRRPLGRRFDHPAQPDEQAPARAVTSARWQSQLRADSALLVTAPIVGLFWVFLDDSGFTGWLGATAITAAVVLWLAAVLGSDPSGW